MNHESRTNLSESLRSSTVDMGEVALILTRDIDDEEVKIQAEILDKIAEDAREAAGILRNSLRREQASPLPPRRIPADRPGTHRTPPDKS